jgi:poly-gamma-glutamate synthesis protein (capsule biosynthesis protein)
MTGRGIDQILGHPCSPVIHEGLVQSALDYVRLAEEANGPIPRDADSSYVWGTALDEWRHMQPHARIINLETSITHCEDYAPKGINYRMSPENGDCLAAAGIDCCVLANNHVLDWGRTGLLDTLSTLERLRIKVAGAGRDLAQASAPAVLGIAGEGRVLVFSYASVTSGTPSRWAATAGGAGVNLLPDLSEGSAMLAAEHITRVRQPGDLIIVSIHWGPNWGREIPKEQQRFAHALIDNANVSVIHGHSSHHAKAIEVYRHRLILYGCGDFLNDYEGITGYEEYRDDLALMYFADVDKARGDLAALTIVPLQIRRFRLNRASVPDVAWLQETLNRASGKFAVSLTTGPDGRLTLSWQVAENRPL